MKMAAGVRIYSIHDLAFTISLNLTIGDQAHDSIIALQKELQKILRKDLIDLVPAYNSISLYFSTKTALERGLPVAIKIADRIASLQNAANEPFIKKEETVIVEIPVCYELPFAFDMPAVMELLKLTHQEIIQQHHQKTYTVFMNGFVPGFSYMGTLNETLQVPRKQVPVAKVPAGSVAIAANQTGIYPFEGPGGWYVIGRTPLKMFDKKRSPACILAPGDLIRFKPITVKEFEHGP